MIYGSSTATVLTERLIFGPFFVDLVYTAAGLDGDRRIVNRTDCEFTFAVGLFDELGQLLTDV